MPVEFIGIARTADRSEIIAETGPAVPPEYLYHLLDAAAYADLIRLVHEQVGEDIDGYRARVAA